MRWSSRGQRSWEAKSFCSRCREAMAELEKSAVVGREGSKGGVRDGVRVMSRNQILNSRSKGLLHRGSCW